MKHSSLFKLIITLGLSFMVCKGDVAPAIGYGLQDYIPIFMSRSELERSVKYADEARPIKETGKIYMYGDTIFINEPYCGIHIIDNSNPKSPRAVNYIIAPGCLDMAVKGDIIYIDNAVDLVAFDMKRGVVTQRITNYFPEHIYSPDDMLSANRYDRPEDYILVRWEKVSK